MHPPQVNTYLSKFNKRETPKKLMIKYFYEIIHNNHYDFVLYSDASKSDTGVGCSVTTANNLISTSLIPPLCSVHTEELYSILQAFKHINRSNKKVAICTDSLASILSIKELFTEHPIEQDIHHSYHHLYSLNTTVTIIWIPSHIGIPGNELADQHAKTASTTATITSHIQICKDVKAEAKIIVRYIWQTHWSSTKTSLLSIQPVLSTPLNADSTGLSRQELSILRRLQIGHTKLTHSTDLLAKAASAHLLLNTFWLIVTNLAQEDDNIILNPSYKTS